MTRPYLPFVDWLKSAGLALIVADHVAHALLPWHTVPFYSKQLGVAFFVFVTGYTLAGDARAPARVVLSRWFDVFAWGLMFAVVMTIVGVAVLGDGNLSDYLPLAGGLNVLRDAFPANPTTWYVGTYLHILVLWALVLRGRRITWPLWLAAVALEVGARAWMAGALGLYVAYQSVFNWLIVLMLGLRLGATGSQPQRRRIPIFAVAVVVWSIAIAAAGWEETFPFRMPTQVDGPIGWLAMSAAVSVGYVLHSINAFHLLGVLPPSAVARFFARNTLLVFIGHMPVFYAMQATLAGSVPQPWRALLEFGACFVGLALLSEVSRPLIRPWLDAARSRLLAATFPG